MGHQMHFMIIFVGVDIFIMNCVFLIELFHHMVVTNDKIIGRRSLILSVLDATSVP